MGVPLGEIEAGQLVLDEARGVVDEDGGWSGQGGKQRLADVGCSEVGGNHDGRRSTGGGEAGGERIRLGPRAVAVDRDPEALLGEGGRERGTDPPGPAGDDGKRRIFARDQELGGDRHGEGRIEGAAAIATGMPPAPGARHGVPLPRPGT
jgi:hypothetical protein